MQFNAMLQFGVQTKNANSNTEIDQNSSTRVSVLTPSPSAATSERRLQNTVYRRVSQLRACRLVAVPSLPLVSAAN